MCRSLDRQLMLAVWRGDVTGCRRLLQNKANPNVRGQMNITCLHYSAQRLDVKVACSEIHLVKQIVFFHGAVVFTFMASIVRNTSHSVCVCV
eukprot:5692558-Amphidinium_carterae.1